MKANESDLLNNKQSKGPSYSKEFLPGDTIDQ